MKTRASYLDMNANRVHLFLFCLNFVISVSREVGCLFTSPESLPNGSLTVCPGDPISVTCTHNSTAPSISITVWVLPGVQTACSVLHRSNPTPLNCSPFTITMVSDNSGPTVSSTAEIVATESLDGMVVECLGGDPPIQVGTVNISVLNIPTPSIILLTQVSLSTVEVNMEVSTNSFCAATFVATATQDGDSETISGMNSTSPVSVSGLDVCQYNYSFVGSVVTSGGVAGEMSTATSFTADLSVLNGITVTINQADPLIEWVQMDNPLYPTCITGYEIRDETNMLLALTVDSSTRSVSGQTLSAAGFPYCSRIQPTVAPVTPMRLLGAVPGSNTNVTDLIDPDFPQPMLSPTFPPLPGSENTTVITLHVNLKSVLQSVVPTRNYQYILNGTTFPVINFIGDYFEIELPAAAAGQTVVVNVTFQNGPCNSLLSDTYIVPSLMITDVIQDQPTDTSQTITITLPLTEYQPEQLLIITTVEPPSDDGPIMANFTSPSMQYTVTFTDLDPATEYTFTIRIFLRSNNTVDVVQPVSGNFTTAATPTMSMISTEASIAIAVCLTFLLTLVLGVSIGVLSVLGYQRCRRSGQSSQTETEMETPPAAEYEVPIVTNPDPHTQRNEAYGHVQF